ncbi:MAG TPA: thiamine phosphate synthase [Solirubrobacterales bacterium]|nr:thiamine phosphate synthase [Solirubrobacterales bacterium]
MSLATPESAGPLRRERLRTARLYFCCDARPRGEDPEPLLRAALSGGVDIVQLREKSLPRREIERSALTFRRLCDTYSALFVVNDDPDLARACNADGVHVGQDDMPAEEVREILGPDVIVGLSTHTKDQIAASGGAPDQADQGRRERGVLRTRATEDADMRRSGAPSGVDYISVGPIWETPTKEGRPAVGLELISHAAENAPRPFFAIGGIDPSNAAEVVEAGARRLCVVRAIRDAEDPAAVAAQLRGAFTEAGDVAPGG